MAVKSALTIATTSDRETSRIENERKCVHKTQTKYAYDQYFATAYFVDRIPTKKQSDTD